MIVVGHRGARGHAPENTLKSFAKAIEMGCQRVEFDIQLSADGMPVVIHDPMLDRTTNGRGPVRELSLAELKKLDAGEGESIPTLIEALRFCKGKADVQVELKDSECPAVVADLLKSEWGSEKLVVTSLEVPTLLRFAALMPGIPMGHLNNDPNHDMVVAALEQGHRWICPRCDVVTQEGVGRAHGAGLLVYVYHVNDRETAERTAAWGVDAIGTDFPEIALDLSGPRGAGRAQG